MAWKETDGTAWTWYRGQWHAGNPMIMGPMTHAPWLGSCVFDGGRAFEGVAPDLDRHCRRIIASAESFGLKAIKQAGANPQFPEYGERHFIRGHFGRLVAAFLIAGAEPEIVAALRIAAREFGAEIDEAKIATVWPPDAPEAPEPAPAKEPAPKKKRAKKKG